MSDGRLSGRLSGRDGGSTPLALGGSSPTGSGGTQQQRMKMWTYDYTSSGGGGGRGGGGTAMGSNIVLSDLVLLSEQEMELEVAGREDVSPPAAASGSTGGGFASPTAHGRSSARSGVAASVTRDRDRGDDGGDEAGGSGGGGGRRGPASRHHHASPGAGITSAKHGPAAGGGPSGTGGGGGEANALTTAAMLRVAKLPPPDALAHIPPARLPHAGIQLEHGLLYRGGPASDADMYLAGRATDAARIDTVMALRRRKVALHEFDMGRSGGGGGGAGGAAAAPPGGDEPSGEEAAKEAWDGSGSSAAADEEEDGGQALGIDDLYRAQLRAAAAAASAATSSAADAPSLSTTSLLPAGASTWARRFQAKQLAASSTTLPLHHSVSAPTLAATPLRAHSTGAAAGTGYAPPRRDQRVTVEARALAAMPLSDPFIVSQMVDMSKLLSKAAPITMPLVPVPADAAAAAASAAAVHEERDAARAAQAAASRRANHLRRMLHDGGSGSGSGVGGGSGGGGSGGGGGGTSRRGERVASATGREEALIGEPAPFGGPRDPLLLFNADDAAAAAAAMSAAMGLNRLPRVPSGRAPFRPAGAPAKPPPAKAPPPTTATAHRASLGAAATPARSAIRSTSSAASLPYASGGGAAAAATPQLSPTTPRAGVPLSARSLPPSVHGDAGAGTGTSSGVMASPIHSGAHRGSLRVDVGPRGSVASLPHNPSGSLRYSPTSASGASGAGTFDEGDEALGLAGSDTARPTPARSAAATQELLQLEVPTGPLSLSLHGATLDTDALMQPGTAALALERLQSRFSRVFAGAGGGRTAHATVAAHMSTAPAPAAAAATLPTSRSAVSHPQVPPLAASSSNGGGMTVSGSASGTGLYPPAVHVSGKPSAMLSGPHLLRSASTTGMTGITTAAASSSAWRNDTDVPAVPVHAPTTRTVAFPSPFIGEVPVAPMVAMGPRRARHHGAPPPSQTDQLDAYYEWRLDRVKRQLARARAAEDAAAAAAALEAAAAEAAAHPGVIGGGGGGGGDDDSDTDDILAATSRSLSYSPPRLQPARLRRRSRGSLGGGGGVTGTGGGGGGGMGSPGGREVLGAPSESALSNARAAVAKALQAAPPAATMDLASVSRVRALAAIRGASSSGTGGGGGGGGGIGVR